MGAGLDRLQRVGETGIEGGDDLGDPLLTRRAPGFGVRSRRLERLAGLGVIAEDLDRAGHVADLVLALHQRH